MFRKSAEDSAGRRLAVLYREHAESTYRFALHMCGSRHDAEDLTQTAFLEAHRKLMAGDELVSPRAWLASVVRTRASNLRRDRHDIPGTDQLELLGRAVDPVDAGDELQRIRIMLWSLPEAQHQAFVLRHWCDLSNREIAQLLDTTEPAVESLLVRARRAIGGAEHMPQVCLETRERLAQGLPETQSTRSHIAQCRGCRTAAERLTRAAGIAAVLALAPRISVAHSLAATVPGFSAAAATSASSGVAGAAATKSLIAKALVTTVAVGATATAVHTGVGPFALLHSRASAMLVAHRAAPPPTSIPDTSPVVQDPATDPFNPTPRQPPDAARHTSVSGQTEQSGQAGSSQERDGSDRQEPTQPGGTDGGGSSSTGDNQQGDSQGGSGDSNSGTGGDGGGGWNDGNTTSGGGGGDGGASGGSSDGGTTGGATSD